MSWGIGDKILFKNDLKNNGVRLPTEEYQFHSERKWRFDFCWPDKKIAVEVEGGVFTNGRHTRGSGYIKDLEKYNAAVMEGWKLLRYTPDQMKKLSTITQIKELLCTS